MYITEEKINKNYLLWIELLKKYDCYSEELINDYGELIKNGTFAMTETSGGAYQGSLLDVVLTTLCVIATHINEDAFGLNAKEKYKHQYLHCDKTSIMKVLLLQHISKAEMFVSTNEEWKRKKGIFYDFNSTLPTSLKLGERSLFLCSKYGIKFTEEEYEALRICDKDEEKNNSFMNPLAELVKIANQLTAIELYQKAKQQENS